MARMSLPASQRGRPLLPRSAAATLAARLGVAVHQRAQVSQPKVIEIAAHWEISLHWRSGEISPHFQRL